MFHIGLNSKKVGDFPQLFSRNETSKDTLLLFFFGKSAASFVCVCFLFVCLLNWFSSLA